MKRKKVSIAQVFKGTRLRPRSRLCDAPECRRAARYRAPKSRHNLDDYFWFCLEHVREYNRNWNYCSGMSASEIECQIRSDLTWQRPTWGLSGKGGLKIPYIKYGQFGPSTHENKEVPSRVGYEETWHPRPQSEEAGALRELGLEPPFTLDRIKTCYKTLVKEYHPDKRGGDKKAEERLKSINNAYAILMSCQDIK